MRWLHLPAPMEGCFADKAWLISQLEPIVLLLNEGWETGGSLSKGTAAGSISEFIRQLTCSHQYLFIITGFGGRSRCCSVWPYYQWPLITDNSLCSSYFVALNIWCAVNKISLGYITIDQFEVWITVSKRVVCLIWAWHAFQLYRVCKQFNKDVWSEFEGQNHNVSEG